MKRVLLSLLMGLVLLPLQLFADHYDYDKMMPPSPPPARSPALYQIAFGLDYYSGNLYICPNYDITGLTITLTGNGVTYISTTVSLTAGQAYLDSLAGYALGNYTLTLSTADGVIDQYAITVEPD